MKKIAVLKLSVILSFVLGLFFVAGATPVLSERALQQQSTDVDPNYVLGPEDMMTIVVRGIPEFSGDFLVAYDGTIRFQIIGTIKAAGMSLSELQKKITEGLKKELRDPQVTVNLKQPRPRRIYIQGAVNRAEFYDYKKGWRITELIASAGGLNLPPERLKALIFRQGSPTITIQLRKILIDGDDTADLELQPGDFVNIQPDPQVRVNVVGEVNQSGLKQVYEGQGAVEALAAAFGATQHAALSRAVITRAGKAIPVDLYAAVINGDTTKNVAIMDNDTLTIPQQYQRISVVGMVNRPGSQVLPDGRPWTLSMAIGEAGGIVPRAKGQGVLSRVGPDGKIQTIKFSVKTLGLKNNPDLQLKENDLVFLPQSGAVNFNDYSGLATIYYVLRTAGLF